MGRKLQASFSKVCKDVQSLHDFAKECANLYSDQCVYYLVGNVGAGKTEWTKGYCKAIGYDLSQSPSFSLENVYETSSKTVRHFDLYRLESEEEIVTSGIWDVLDAESDVVIIEWANLLSLQDIPNHRPIVKLIFQTDRRIEIEVYAALDASSSNI